MGMTVQTSGSMWPNYACCNLVASGMLMWDPPVLVGQIVNIYLPATNYANASPEEAARIYSNLTGQDLYMVKRSVETWDGRWIRDPHLKISSTLAHASSPTR